MNKCNTISNCLIEFNEIKNPALKYKSGFYLQTIKFISHLIRYSDKFFNNRLSLASSIFPIEPAISFCGITDKNPIRITDDFNKPLCLKSTS